MQRARRPRRPRIAGQPPPLPSGRSPSPGGGGDEGGGGSPRRAAKLPPGLVFLGEFGRAHGLAGEVRLKSHTGDPKAIASYGPLTGQDGRAYVITHARQAAGDQPDLLVVRVEGVTDRNAAEALNRIALHVPREKLGEAEEDEFFLADLVGLRAEGPDGEVGRVVAVPDYGGGELLEISLPGRRQTALLPFTKEVVPLVDIAGGFVRIAPPEGWLDEGDDERA